MPTRIIIALFCILVLIFLRPIISQLTSGLECIRVPRKNVALESIAFKSHRRTAIALLLMIPSYLVWSSLNLHYFKFSEGFAPDFVSPAIILVSYVIVKVIACKSIKTTNPQSLVAAMRSSWTISIYYSCTFGILWLVMSTANASATAMIIMSIIVFSAFYALNLWLQVQILRTTYSKIKVFLYLCALEIIPVTVSAGIILLL